MSWDLELPEPLSVPGRRPVVTLRDAAAYIMNLPEDQQKEARCQSAIHCLIQTADQSMVGKGALNIVPQAAIPLAVEALTKNRPGKASSSDMEETLPPKMTAFAFY